MVWSEPRFGPGIVRNDPMRPDVLFSYIAKKSRAPNLALLIGIRLALPVNTSGWEKVLIVESSAAENTLLHLFKGQQRLARDRVKRKIRFVFWAGWPHFKQDTDARSWASIPAGVRGGTILDERGRKDGKQVRLMVMAIAELRFQLASTRISGASVARDNPQVSIAAGRRERHPKQFLGSPINPTGIFCVSAQKRHRSRPQPVPITTEGNSFASLLGRIRRFEPGSAV